MADSQHEFYKEIVSHAEINSSANNMLFTEENILTLTKEEKKEKSSTKRPASDRRVLK